MRIAPNILVCLCFNTLFLLTVQLGHSQINLVPNPSFEDTISCPTLTGQVSKAKFWHDLFHTPDYFNECCVTPGVGVPSNIPGYQYPSSGNAYMGFFTYYGPDTNYREIIGSNLINPLTVGTKYFVTYKLSLSGNPAQAIRVATNKTGILFSTIDYISTPPPINNFSQVYCDSIITDTINWITVRKSFVADSSYSFISIGNFYQNYLTDTIRLTNNNGLAYYYLDDVCISEDSLYCEVWTGLPNGVNNEKMKIFPNPAIDIITIDNIPWGCSSISIYNELGIQVEYISLNKNIKTRLNMGSLPIGMYSFIFKLKDSLITKKIIHITQ